MSETPDTTPEGELIPVEATTEPSTEATAEVTEPTTEAAAVEAVTPVTAPEAVAEPVVPDAAPVAAPAAFAPVETPPVAAQPAPPVAPQPAYAQPAQPAFAQAAPPIPPTFVGPAVVAAQPEKKRSRTFPVVAAVAVGAVLGGAAGAGVAAWAVSSSVQDQPADSAGSQTITVNDPEKVNAVTAVAAKAAPSVVTINVTAGSSGGTGSGVILNSDGYVLTNTHVVTLDGESADGKIEVTTYDGKLYKATVVGTDPTLDLAVIKLTDASGLTPIEFGDSSKLNVGDRVVAIGAPLGLSNTVTDGIVSALDRSISIASSAAPTGGSDSSDGNGSGNNGNGPFDFWNDQNQGSTGNAPTSTISLPVIQTDASINPGNSGGALVDNDGRLVGINVAIASTGSSGEGQSGSIGVGFSIPEDVAQRVATEIIKNGSATHGLLGASVQDATSADSSTVGAIIKEITSGGAADKAGLKAGDVVTNFNGAPITNATDLTAQVRSLAAGSTAKLTYTRSGSPTTVTVTLGSLPKS